MKKIILIVIQFIFVFHFLNAQVVVTIGDENYSQYQLPISSNSEYSFSQSIYKQEFIHAVGAINKLSYYFVGTASWTTDVQIYMGHTLKNEFGLTDYIPFNELTLVYDGSLSATGVDGWIEITLDTEFNYNNNDNLVIAFYEYSVGANSGDFHFSTSNIDNDWSSMYYESASPFNPITSDIDNSDRVSKYIPNIKLEGDLTLTNYIYCDGRINKIISTDFGSTDTFNIVTNAASFVVNSTCDWLNIESNTTEKIIKATTTSSDNTLRENREAEIMVISDLSDTLYVYVTQNVFEEKYNAKNGLGYSMKWGDYDADGDLDIIESGHSWQGPTIYKNLGNDNFIPINITSIEDLFITNWCDFDNDGDLDILISSSGYTSILRNDGGDVFTDMQLDFAHLGNFSIDWGDLDNNGYNDVFITGVDDAENMTKSVVYLNNKDY